MKKLIVSLLLFITTTVSAVQGPISGGGGSVVAYQAIALMQIMSDISNNISIIRQYFPASGVALKSIEFLYSQRDHRYPYGRSVYRLQNSGNCFVDVEAIAQDETGMKYVTRWGELHCQRANPCTEWGGETPLPPQCRNHL